jgi:hypothetical protein
MGEGYDKPVIFRMHIRNTGQKKKFHTIVTDSSRRMNEGCVHFSKQCFMLLRINSNVVWNKTSESSTSHTQSPFSSCGHGHISSETLTELATALAILVPSPTPHV